MSAYVCFLRGNSNFAFLRSLTLPRQTLFYYPLSRYARRTLFYYLLSRYVKQGRQIASVEPLKLFARDEVLRNDSVRTNETETFPPL